MNLEQLRGFAAIAETGNFTRAAEKLHLSQPSLSRQISSLEQELGMPLLDRARGGSTLTAAGEVVYPLARRMLADASSIRRELDELAGLARGRVRLGATPSLCAGLVTEVLTTFRPAHPGVELHIVEEGSRRLLERLGSGELDLALITTSAARVLHGVSVAPLLEEELVLVSSASSPVVGDAPTVDVPTIATLPLIMFSATYDLRATTEAAFAAASVAPTVAIEGLEMDAVLRFVERGLGVAIVPATVLLERPSLRATRISDPVLSRTIGIARVDGVRLGPATLALRNALLSTAATLATEPDNPLALVAGSHD
ncbi:LysR family transcriptional regulator [Microbacterium sp. Marseille-Q6965]|uniref:LysR family transcriptional regulator n=1 Tax=Microbacterium sp. Marseille-Q6965 TaxID=2965072 RepID=UPI0021B7A67B|nr:LysR family transcriptional regulator [Microbacterium sp. Marseille-Q6965]